MYDEQVVSACRTCVTLLAAERKRLHVLCSRIKGQYTGREACQQQGMEEQANSSTLQRRHTATAWLRRSAGCDPILQNKKRSTWTADSQAHESADATNAATLAPRSRKNAERLATPRFMRRHVSKDIRTPVFQQ
jgi:hypothetical protein